MQRAVRLDEEVMMMAGVGVEIGPAGRHHHFAQQPCIPELIKRVVDRGQGDRHLRRLHLDMKAFRSDMAGTALEQQARQSHPLPRRAKAGRAQAGSEIVAGSGHGRTHM